MTSITTSLRSVAAAAVLGAAVFAAPAQAVTLVNHAAPIEVTAGATTGGPTDTYGPSPFVFAFDYVGGLVKILLDDTNPDQQTVSYSLYNVTADSLVANFSFDDVLDGAAKPFYSTLLSAGAYTLTITTSANSSTTFISAVPLPGAALLFGSTVLGYLGVNKRRNKA